MNHELLVGAFVSQLWQVTVLIVLVACVARLVGRQRPHLSYLLWLLVMIKCVTPPIWSSPVGLFSWAERTATDQNLDEWRVTDPEYRRRAGESGDERVLAHIAVDPTGASRLKATPPRSALAGIATAATAVWMAVAGGLLLVSAYRWLACYRRVTRARVDVDDASRAYVAGLAQRLGLRRPVRLLVTAAPVGPAVFGVFRPTVILPAALLGNRSLDDLEPIIAHELIHARRGDTAASVLQFVTQVVWWFHPLVWWANRHANLACERCCDREVVACLGCRPSRYAGCLLDVLELRHRMRPVIALSGVRSAEVTSKRVEEIMKSSNEGIRRTPWTYWCVAALLAVLVLPGAALVRGAIDDDAEKAQKILAQADEAFAKQDWGAAADKYRQLTELNNDDGRAWFRLGYALHAAGRLDEAIGAHTEATRFPRARPTALYNLACAHCLKNEKDKALDYLRQALEAGFASAQPITSDPDFAQLLDDPRFQKLAEQAHPASQNPAYRQFDFWVGTWDVFDAKGDQVGTNVISKDEQGFLLTEKWTNVEGRTGTSINYYDPSARKWRQTWIDASGNIIKYSGDFRDGKMKMAGEMIMADGKTGRSRMTFTPLENGRVRQYIERSLDDGQTWSVYFDGTYVRHETN